MPKVGEILELSHKDSGTARVVVLQIESRAKRMLVAFISKESAVKLSRIDIGAGHYAYPSIQATVWLNVPNTIDRPERAELSQSLTNLIYVWPALTLDEKTARAESAGAGVVRFGEKGQELTEEFVQAIRVLQKLSMRLLRNSSFPPQLSPNLFAKKLLSSSKLSINVLEESSFALFSGTSLVEPLTSHLDRVGTGQDVYRSLLIRKSAQIRSANNLMGSDSRNDLLIKAQSFMKQSGLDFMHVLASTEEDSVFTSKRQSASKKHITVRLSNV